MFGGHGLYLDDLFFGLIAYDKLYLKTDEQNRGDYVKAKAEAVLVREPRKGLVVTSYWQCPAAVMKDGAQAAAMDRQGARCRAPQEGGKAETRSAQAEGFSVLATSAR